MHIMDAERRNAQQLFGLKEVMKIGATEGSAGGAGAVGIDGS